MKASRRIYRLKIRQSLVLLAIGLMPILVSGHVYAQSEKAAGPRKTADFFQAEEEKDFRELESIVDQSIRELEEIAVQIEERKSLGEVWLRLAELNIEKAELVEDRLQREHARAAAEGSVKPINLTPAKRYNQKSLRYYKNFVENFSRDRRADQALFFLGFNNYEIGNVEEGAKYYRMLTKRFPRSRYISEAQFALGEHQFENENWQQAQRFYEKVIRDKSSRLYLFALYKRAWCFYQRGQFRSALKAMERVLEESRVAGDDLENPSASGRKLNRVRLAAESLKDLVPFYAESGKSYRQAIPYMQNIGSERLVQPLVEKLAYLYSDRGDKRAAEYLFRRLIARKPLSSKAFSYQYQVVNNYRSSIRTEKFKRELRALIKNYSEESEWGRVHKDDRKLMESSNKLRESTLRSYVLQWHQTAKNSRQKFSQTQALQGYRLYFKHFKKSPKSDLMHFYFGELLYDIKDYDGAAKEYFWVLKNAPKSQFAEPSTINIASTLEKGLPSEEKLRKKVGKSLKPVPLGPLYLKFEEAANSYLKRFPKGERKVPLLFTRSRIYYLHNRFDPALEGFEEVVKLSPKSKYGEYSANLILDIYKLRGDYQGIQKAAQRLKATGVSRVISDDIQSVIETSSFKIAESLEKKNDHLKAAQGFDKFAKENPKSSLYTSAIFNAAVNYQKAGEILPAIGLYRKTAAQRLRGKKAKEAQLQRLQRKSHEQLSQLYIQTGQYERAAAEFETLGRWKPRLIQSKKYWLGSAVIRKNLKHWNTSLNSFEKYLQVAKGNRAMDAYYHMGDIWQKRKNSLKATDLYKKYIQSNPVNADLILRAHVRIAQLYKARKNFKESENWYAKTGQVYRRIYKRSKKSQREALDRDILAEADHARVLKNVRDYQKISWSAAEKKSGASGQKATQALISKKLKKFEELKKQLARLVKIKSPDYVVAALYHQGQIFLQTHQFFLDSPVPKGLSAAEKKKYLEQLQKQAAPFRQSAVNGFEKAIEQSSLLGAYGSWRQRSQVALSRLKKENTSALLKNFRWSPRSDWRSL